MTQALFEAEPEPEPIEFFAKGVPHPQGSHSAMIDPATRRLPPKQWRAIVIVGGTAESRKAHRHWRDDVRKAAEAWLAEHPQEPLDEPLKIRGLFLMPSPQTDQYRTLHATKPDLDKLVRSVFDSLTESGLIVDDSRFCGIRFDAEYAREGEATGCRIRITRHGHEEREARERLKSEAAARRRGWA